MTEIRELFESLTAPSKEDTFLYSAKPFPGFINHKIAIDIFKNPTVLVKTVNPGGVIGTDFKLQNIQVLFEVNCEVKVDGESLLSSLTCIRFIGSDQSLKTYFLRLCTLLIEKIGNTPTNDLVRNEVGKFVELFRLASQPPVKTVQGLWAELFLISIARNPAALIQSWHSIPSEKFDFAIDSERIEVKSSSTAYRIHNFSLDQLNPPQGSSATIVSMFTRQISNGKSIEDLRKTIENALQQNGLAVEKLRFLISQTLGSSVVDALTVNFDHHLALDSMKFYASDQIPSIVTESISKFVSEIKFKSDLTSSPSIEFHDLVRTGPLLSAL